MCRLCPHAEPTDIGLDPVALGGPAKVRLGDSAFSLEFISISVRVLTEEDSVIDGVLTLMIGSQASSVFEFVFELSPEIDDASACDSGLMMLADSADLRLYAIKVGALVIWSDEE